ncbi:glucose-6-phosphate isomerase [Alterisphingorhabdus coralli]|uniref:Glucose-6-phosphate isomerase n=1 Tax=Alterisphingorhabdus coralli TaxID=3071408 RepID=A0AA97I1D2_9SPHN|nr:glucose-6-phosphate isomerase [Parasphingorhabdus sp. SCSIO 66989]WOE76624.1 glucose-6-phosphate isomerase [Parasphingorhabdus sp. SCSIO 66989]
MTQSWAWLDKAAAASTPIEDMFAEDSERLSRLSLDVNCGDATLYFDFSKTHLTTDDVGRFAEMAEKFHLSAARERLFGGEVINITEERAAEHSAERGTGATEAVERAFSLRQRMYGLVGAIQAGAFGEIKHLIHIGIGGSALGPDMLYDALAREDAQCDVHIVSNVDGAALAEAFAACDPQTTMIAIASKTFTTTETLRNAESAVNWLKQEGVEDPYGRCIALTAAPEKASEWGIDDARILPFSETVGGRYSLWSSIGFPFALAGGQEAFDALLAGAAAMDAHFRDAPFERNAPILAACVDQYYARGRKAQTRAIFAYDERLRLLPDYLQQLEMESNGKSVTLNGDVVDVPTAAISWGGVGTDAQHAVFQLLHQGTHILPIEFVASAEPGHDLDPEHHAILLSNCFAQGAALMQGRASDDPHRHYGGDRPSTTILLDDVSPAALGALIAFYEHRVFANAVFMNINPFDQFGVELGKAIAKSIATDADTAFDPSTQALLSRVGLQ